MQQIKEVRTSAVGNAMKWLGLVLSCVCVCFVLFFLHCTYIALDCRRSAHDSEQLSEADSYTAGFKIKGQVWLRCCAAATVLMSGLGVENSGLCRGRC